MEGCIVFVYVSRSHGKATIVAEGLMERIYFINILNKESEYNLVLKKEGMLRI